MDDIEQSAENRDSSGRESNSLARLPIYLMRTDKGVVEALNVPARNAMAHQNAALLKQAVADALRRRANGEGSFFEEAEEEGKEGFVVVRWKPSIVPFHVEFNISASDVTWCQHLASVRCIVGKDPEQYARSLVPLAKCFLSKPSGSHSPHLPFTRPQIPSDFQSNVFAEDKRFTATIQHARLINDQYKNLNEIDIKTAEATAKMVNAGEILSGLLAYLTSPKPRAVVSKKPLNERGGEVGSTERPLSSVLKQPKAELCTNRVKSLDLKTSSTVDDVRTWMITANSYLQEKSAPNAKSPVGESLIGKPADAVSPSQKSKSNGQRRKQSLRERSDTFTVSAYPTQRPPRQKRVKKNGIIRESLQRKEGMLVDDDLGKAPTNCLPSRVVLDNDSYEEDVPEQWLGNMSRKGSSSADSRLEGYDESGAHSVEEVLNPQPIVAETALPPSNNLQVENLTTNTDESIALSSTTKWMQQHGSGAQGLLWAYNSSSDVDESLYNAGIWLWRKPSTYFSAQPFLQTEEIGYAVQVPAIVSHKRTWGDEPIVELNGETVHIVPREHCWEDVRSHESHPDFLVPAKLAEYQACEVAGYRVWRHDRDLLQCRKLGCDIMTSDFHRSTVICLGCGPKSKVRYCSIQHQMEDIGGHWEECGTWRVILRRVIDHSTAPGGFARMCPAIKQRYGYGTAALHRQLLGSTLSNGHYTLFESYSTSFVTLYWPKQDARWPEMDQRIERLLNIAFFDNWNHNILGYLYRLLRELLRSQGQWTAQTERSLQSQFEFEFSNFKVNPRERNGDAPCECEWTGKIFPQWDHLATCCHYAQAAEEEDWGPVRPRQQRCIKATVEDYEERFWILRAWRQQLPTQSNWRRRAAGYGFPDVVVDEGCYKLGPGWTGWGGEEDNICEDGRNQGKSRVGSV